MRIFALFIAIALPIFASNLLTYNVYERSDRVDVMLSFDAPHEGSISQKNDASSITLTINDLSYDKLIEKSINSPIIQELLIAPEKNNSLKVVLKSDKKISVTASKTVDGFGLRIRSSIASAQSQSSEAKPALTPLQTQTSSSDSIVDTRYIVVIIVLVLLVAFLFWLKKKVKSGNLTLFKPTQKNNSKSWLFNPASNKEEEVTLLHKKAIDNQNSVVLFEYGNIRYLVMTGNSNVLLEKFQNGEVKNDGEFEKVFEENRRRLDEYLKLQDTKLTTYKNKASADYRTFDDEEH